MNVLIQMLVFICGALFGYAIRRSVEEEFHIPCTDDDDI